MKLLLSLIVTSLMASHAFADHTCDSKVDSLLIDRRIDKVQSGYVDFIAESRVQKFTTTAKMFIWCITNIHQYHVAEFKWGSSTDDDKYFSAIVEPGREVETTRTDSSDVRLAGRQIKFRRLNSSLFKQTYPETIFFDRLGDKSSLLKLVQFRDDNEFVQVDFEKLSEDLSALNRFVGAQRKIQFGARITATVPANKETQAAIEKHGYEGYARRDFARITVTLLNRLMASPSGPISVVDVQIFAIDGRASDALKTVPIRIAVESVDQKAQLLTRSLPLEFIVENDSQYVVFMEGPVERLSYVDLSLTVRAADTNFVFASLPMTILLPVRR